MVCEVSRIQMGPKNECIIQITLSQQNTTIIQYYEWDGKYNFCDNIIYFNGKMLQNPQLHHLCKVPPPSSKSYAANSAPRRSHADITMLWTKLNSTSVLLLPFPSPKYVTLSTTLHIQPWSTFLSAHVYCSCQYYCTPIQSYLMNQIVLFLTLCILYYSLLTLQLYYNYLQLTISLLPSMFMPSIE